MNSTKELSSRNISEKAKKCCYCHKNEPAMASAQTIVSTISALACIFSSSFELLFHKWMIRELFHYIFYIVDVVVYQKERRNEYLQPFSRNGWRFTRSEDALAERSLPRISMFTLPLINTPFIFVYVSFVVSLVPSMIVSYSSFRERVSYLHFTMVDFSSFFRLSSSTILR